MSVAQNDRLHAATGVILHIGAEHVASAIDVTLRTMTGRTDMTTLRPTELFAATRDSLHRVAEHVLAAAQYADTGEISLCSVTGGFQTAHPLRGNRRVSIVDAQLVVSDDTGARAVPLTTVAAAAQFVGVEPGMPAT